MEYGTGAIFGCPAHDERDLEFANAYGLGNTPVVCPPGVDPASFVITDVAYDGEGTHDQFPVPRWHDDLAGQGRGRQRCWRTRSPATGRSASARSISACATGAFRASAIGAARSRSSTARTAASCRCPKQDLPVVLPDDVSFDVPGNPLDRHPDLEARALPAMRQAGPARDRHDGHLRRFVLVFRPLHRPVDDGRADRPRRGR